MAQVGTAKRHHHNSSSSNHKILPHVGARPIGKEPRQGNSWTEQEQEQGEEKQTSVTLPWIIRRQQRPAGPHNRQRQRQRQSRRKGKKNRASFTMVELHDEDLLGFSPQIKMSRCKMICRRLKIGCCSWTILLDATILHFLFIHAATANWVRQNMMNLRVFITSSLVSAYSVSFSLSFSAPEIAIPLHPPALLLLDGKRKISGGFFFNFKKKIDSQSQRCLHSAARSMLWILSRKFSKSQPPFPPLPPQKKTPPNYGRKYDVIVERKRSRFYWRWNLVF